MRNSQCPGNGVGGEADSEVVAGNLQDNIRLAAFAQDMRIKAGLIKKLIQFSAK